jgi:hypothetical protein
LQKGKGYYLRANGSGSVKVNLKLDWSGTGAFGKTAVTKITIPTEQGPDKIYGIPLNFSTPLYQMPSRRITHE